MTAATFQSTVNINYGFGVIGELIVDGPQRADSLTLDASGGTIGNAFTKSKTTNIATQGGVIGGSAIFAGILADPKVYASRGVSASPLDPTLVLPGNSQGEFVTMGTIVVNLATAANIGDQVTYDTTTGALSAVAPVATFTASQATTVLTVTAITGGSIGVGSVITSGGAIIGKVLSLGTGTGGTGTYNLDTSATVSSGAMTATSAPAAGTGFVPNAVVWNFPTSAAGLVAIRLTN